MAQQDFTPRENVRTKRYFSEPELTEMRKTQTDKQIELDEIEEEIKTLKQNYASKIKEIKSTCSLTRHEIKAGFTFEERLCYFSPNFETGMMEYTDCETSEVLMERKLLPAEKQLNFSPSK